MGSVVRLSMRAARDAGIVRQVVACAWKPVAYELDRESGVGTVISKEEPLNLRARACDRSLEGAETISPNQVSEAIQYRTFDRTLWI